ncbi:MAG: S41 family peptidase, partial [Chitinophagaceae bacterium]
YVDPVKIDSINQIVVDDLLSKLDPHSVFIPSKYLKEVNEDLMGNFQGIGIEFQFFNDTLNVVNIIKDGPSDKAGIEIGDQIIKANDTVSLTGKTITTEEIRKHLRGISGTKVTLTILRFGKTKKIEVTRGNIPVSTIDAAYMIAPTVGYIKINKFGDRTYEEFMQSLEKNLKAGMQSLIVDLRGNGGGLMTEATAIADEFLSDDKLIVYTEGSKSPRYDYKCRKEGLLEKGKIAVLVDETSASASEVLSGALQDWDRATIIGRRTFGKGLVQQQYPLSDGSALRLTVARYFTPLGRNIQKPYSNKSKKDYEEELINRFHTQEKMLQDSVIDNPKKQVFKTPSGRKVYGGGGITPDILVGYDSSKKSAAFIRLINTNILNNFIYKYYVHNKSRLEKVTNTEELNAIFKGNDDDWNAFLQLVKQQNLLADSISFSERNFLIQQMKALLARQIWRNEGYFKITNLQDSTVKKAMEIIK